MPALPEGYRFFPIPPLGVNIPIPKDWQYRIIGNQTLVASRDTISNLRYLGTALIAQRVKCGLPGVTPFDAATVARMSMAPSTNRQPVGDPEIFKVGQSIVVFRGEFTGPDHQHGLGLPFHSWEEYIAKPLLGSLVRILLRTPESQVEEDGGIAETIFQKRILG